MIFVRARGELGHGARRWTLFQLDSITHSQLVVFLKPCRFDWACHFTFRADRLQRARRSRILFHYAALEGKSTKAVDKCYRRFDFEAIADSGNAAPQCLHWFFLSSAFLLVLFCSRICCFDFRPSSHRALLSLFSREFDSNRAVIRLQSKLNGRMIVIFQGTWNPSFFPKDDQILREIWWSQNFQVTFHPTESSYGQVPTVMFFLQRIIWQTARLQYIQWQFCVLLQFI